MENRYDKDELTLKEAIQLVKHHLDDLYKALEKTDEIDEDIENEMIEYLDETIDDLESFMEDIGYDSEEE